MYTFGHLIARKSRHPKRSGLPAMDGAAPLLYIIMCSRSVARCLRAATSTGLLDAPRAAPPAALAAARCPVAFHPAPAGGSFGPWMGKLRATLAKVGPVWYKQCTLRKEPRRHTFAFEKVGMSRFLLLLGPKRPARKPTAEATEGERRPHADR